MREMDNSCKGVAPPSIHLGVLPVQSNRPLAPNATFLQCVASSRWKRNSTLKETMHTYTLKVQLCMEGISGFWESIVRLVYLSLYVASCFVVVVIDTCIPWLLRLKSILPTPQLTPLMEKECKTDDWFFIFIKKVKFSASCTFGWCPFCHYNWFNIIFCMCLL